MKKIIFNHQVVGIFGLAKNTGKTTTLNHLIELCQNQKIAVTSIGLDGEPFDQIFHLPKPAIYLPSGCILATAKECLNHAKFSYKIIENTLIQTALGPILVIEMITPGFVIVAGPSTNSELETLIDKLKVGRDHVFIDGAFNKKTFTSIRNMDGIILTTGASVNIEMHKTIEKTKSIVKSFNYPQSTLYQDKPVESVIIKTEHKTINILDKKLYHIEDVLRLLNEPVLSMYIKGAITSKCIELLIELNIKDFELVIDDSTKLLVSTKHFGYIDQSNITVSVLKEIPLLAITVNPFSPYGYPYELGVFMRSLKQVIDIPIINVKQKEATYDQT